MSIKLVIQILQNCNENTKERFKKSLPAEMILSGKIYFADPKFKEIC